MIHERDTGKLGVSHNNLGMCVLPEQIILD